MTISTVNLRKQYVSASLIDDELQGKENSFISICPMILEDRSQTDPRQIEDKLKMRQWRSLMIISEVVTFIGQEFF